MFLETPHGHVYVDIGHNDSSKSSWGRLYNDVLVQASLDSTFKDELLRLIVEHALYGFGV